MFNGEPRPGSKMEKIQGEQRYGAVKKDLLNIVAELYKADQAIEKKRSAVTAKRVEPTSREEVVAQSLFTQRQRKVAMQVHDARKDADAIIAQLGGRKLSEEDAKQRIPGILDAFDTYRKSGKELFGLEPGNASREISESTKNLRFWASPPSATEEAVIEEPAKLELSWVFGREHDPDPELHVLLEEVRAKGMPYFTYRNEQLKKPKKERPSMRDMEGEEMRLKRELNAAVTRYTNAVEAKHGPVEADLLRFLIKRDEHAILGALEAKHLPTFLKDHVRHEPAPKRRNAGTAFVLALFGLILPGYQYVQESGESFEPRTTQAEELHNVPKPLPPHRPGAVNIGEVATTPTAEDLAHDIAVAAAHRPRNMSYAGFAPADAPGHEHESTMVATAPQAQPEEVPLEIESLETIPQIPPDILMVKGGKEVDGVGGPLDLTPPEEAP